MACMAAGASGSGSGHSSGSGATLAALVASLGQQQIEEVECVAPDLVGAARGKVLPLPKFALEGGARLLEAALAMGVHGEFPEGGPYDEVINPIDRDLQLRPDPKAVFPVPWAHRPTALIIHDAHDVETGAPIPFAPRNVLRRVLEQYAEEGLRPVVAPELEFYLVAQSADAALPLRVPVGRSGRPEASRQTYSLDALREFGPVLREIQEHCSAMGLPCDTLSHEVGAGSSS